MSNYCKTLLLMLIFVSFAGFSASNIQFLLTNPQYGISQTTNATITLQPVNMGNQGNIQVLPISATGITDTNGQYTFMNLNGGSVQGFYYWTIAIYNSSKRVTGSMWVSSTNLGTISESLIDNVNGAPTYPAGTWAWSMIASDLRYQPNGTNALLQFYPLFGNPSNYVQQATLTAQINAVTNLYTSIVLSNASAFTTPAQSTNIANNVYSNNPAGYLTSNTVPSIPSNVLTNNQLGNVNVATNGTLAVSNLLTSGSIATANIGPTAGSLTISLSGGSLSAGGVTLSPAGLSTAQAQISPSGFIGNGGLITNLNANSITGLVQAINIPSFVVTNGTLLTASNFLGTNILGILIQTNNQLVNLSSNLFGVNSNSSAFASNALQFAKQPASTILTNISVTGANTNQYLSGLGAYLTTNFSGTIQSINISNQLFLTNGITATAFQPLGFYLGTNALPALTNGFVPASITNNFATVPFVQTATNGFVPATITNAFAPTNWVGQNFALQGSVPSTNGFVTSTVTNGLAGTNWVGNNFVLVTATNNFATTNQLAGATNFAGQLFGISTNFSNTNAVGYFGLGTNYANTNALALFQFSTNYSTTNPSPYVVASTNGLARSLYLTNNLMFGLRTNFVFTTNYLAVLANGSQLGGTYAFNAVSNCWLNPFIPLVIVTNNGSAYFLQSNGITLYSGQINTQWSTVSGVGPAPFVFADAEFRCDGIWFGGWLASTNLTWQITNGVSGSAVGGVVQGLVSNELFSTSGTNTIVALIAQFAENPTNGVSAATVSNIVNGMTFTITNGIGIPSGVFAYVPTNGWATAQFVTNLVYVTSNALAGASGNFSLILSNNISIGTSNSVSLSNTSNSIAIGNNNLIDNAALEPSSELNSILEGTFNTNLANAYGTIVNGTFNQLDSQNFEFVGDGSNNFVHGEFDSVLNGMNNTVDANAAFSFESILDGSNNFINSPYSFIGGGQANHIGSASFCNTILDGQTNSINAGRFNIILNGFSNTMDRIGSTLPIYDIIGGEFNILGQGDNNLVIGVSNVVNSGNNGPFFPSPGNYVFGYNNSIIGTPASPDVNDFIFGESNKISSSVSNVVIIGNNGTATISNSINLWAANGVFINGQQIIASASGIYGQIFVTNNAGVSGVATNLYGVYSLGFSGNAYTNNTGFGILLLPGNYTIGGSGISNPNGYLIITNLPSGFAVAPQYGGSTAPETLFGIYNGLLSSPGTMIVSAYAPANSGTVTTQMVFVGTNDPNGTVSAPWGAIYNQFQIGNTNVFLKQRINTNGLTGWQ